MSLPWIEKYRPSCLDEIVDHDDKIKLLKALIDKKELTHLLFSGPPGTGKTSLILNIARYMYGESYGTYVLDINGSSERGIDMVRSHIIEFVQVKKDKIKLIILDEADALTNEAQNALKNVIEKYSKVARFCLICNDADNITPALHSRCVNMIFTKLSKESIKKRVLHIIKEEKIKISKPALEIILNLNKDFRQVINLLQGMTTYYNMNDKMICSTDVYNYLGIPDNETKEEIKNVLFKESHSKCTKFISELINCRRMKLRDVLEYISTMILEVKLPVATKDMLFKTICEIDEKEANGCSPYILINCLVSAFFLARSGK